MTLKSWFLIAVAVVLGGIYVAFFTSWFRHPEIEMVALVRPSLRTRGSVKAASEPQVYPVTFNFKNKFQLTELRVVAVEDEKTNKYPHAVWHLISDSNSIPTKALIYGAPVRGMKPKVPRAEPEQLEPNVAYRLYVYAGKAKGKKEFKTQEIVKPNLAE